MTARRSIFGTVRLGPWARLRERFRASKQQGDPHALDVEGDPRGGLQAPEYRHADPRDLVEHDGVVMAGPAGAPQDDQPVEHSRERADDPAPRSLSGCLSRGRV
jgi:hypothetical protein